MKKIFSAIVIVVCAGTLALAGDGAAKTPVRRQPSAGGRGGRQGGTRGGTFGRQRDRLVERLLKQTSPEDLPPEIKEWADETNFIKLSLGSLATKIENRENELLVARKLSSLRAAYTKAHTTYRKAVAANEEAAKRREEVATIEKEQLELRRRLSSGGQSWQKQARTMRDQREKRRTLETEIAEIIAKDEGIQKLEAVRRKAASAFMAKHAELKENDTTITRMKAEMKALKETQREIDRAVENLAREKGLIPGASRTPSRTGGKQPAASPGKKTAD